MRLLKEQEGELRSKLYCHNNISFRLLKITKDFPFQILALYGLNSNICQFVIFFPSFNAVKKECNVQCYYITILL